MGYSGLRRIFATALAAAASMFAAPAFAQEPIPLDAYGDLPGIEDVAISDSGDHLAIFTAINGVRQVVVFDDQLQLVSRLGADGSKFRGFRFVGDDALLIYTSTTVDVRGFVADQYEMLQAMIFPLDGGAEVAAVFGDTPRLNSAIHGNHGLRYVDGNWKGYFGAIEFVRDSARMGSYVFDHGRPFLYAFDFAERDQERVDRAAPEDTYRDWLIAADGSVAAVFDIDRKTGKWEIRNAANDKIVEGVNLNGDAGLIGLGTDGSTLIYSFEDPEDGETDWYEIPLAGGESTPFLDD